MTNYVNEMYKTLGELIRMHQLNQELLETLSATMQWMTDYAEKHFLPLPNGSAYNSLMNKAEALIEEITMDVPQFPKLHSSDRFLQRKKPDKDFTEPFN